MASNFLNRLTPEKRAALVKNLRSTQAGNCFICGLPIDPDVHVESSDIDIDHVEPLGSGGKDAEDNLAVTHRSCNRSKQATDLRVARLLARFDALAKRVDVENRSPNLGDVLSEHGGSKHRLSATVTAATLKTSFPEIAINEVKTMPIHVDTLSGFRSVFLELPIEYLHHDNYINPRAIGSNLRKLVVEFHRKIPQLHISLGWIDTTGGNKVTVRIIDGQHKAAAQVLLGARSLPVRVFIDPDTEVLLTANTNAGTTLRQVAFDKSVQRSLGSSILSTRIDRYRAERNLDPDDESFSEQELVSHFQGEAREMRRYIVDRVRDGIAHHPNNKLREYIEYGGRTTDRPLSYSTIEKTYFQFFISTDILTTALNYKIEEGLNQRELEIEQTVKLMNIIADQIFIGMFDLGRGTRRIENEVQKGQAIDEDHLRAFRMSKEEVLYNWLKLVRQVIYQYFVTLGEPTSESRLLQRPIPERCWRNVENFIDSLKRLPLWVNRDLSISLFGTKRTNVYWESIFQEGVTPDNVQVLPSGGLNLVEMIKADDEVGAV